MYARLPTLPVYAIHQTVLVRAISCIGQIGGGGVLNQARSISVRSRLAFTR